MSMNLYLFQPKVKVECTKTDMIVTLAFGYPFNGRVYVNGNYQVNPNNNVKIEINL